MHHFITMSKRTLGWLIAILVVLGVVYGVSKRGGGPSTAARPLKLGAILPLTGDAAPYGIPVRRAIELAAEEVNAAGGVGGKPLTVAWGDGKCNGADGAAEAQKLVNVDGVTVIFGGACSGETIPIAPITEPKQVLVISPCASSPKITDIGDFVFRTYPSDALAGKVGAGYAREVLKLQKIALITEQTDYAQGLREAFKRTFGEAGGAVVADEVYQTGATDFRTQLLKMKEANPDAVYLVPQSGNPGLLILRQLQELGYKGKRLTAEVLMDRKLVGENARLLEGLVGVEAALDDADPKVTAFLAKYQAKHNEELSGIPLCSANGYTQVYLLKEAVAAVGTDTAKIRDWLYGLKGWVGPLGTLTFDRNGDPITGYYGIREVINGKVGTLGSQRIVDGSLQGFEAAGKK